MLGWNWQLRRVSYKVLLLIRICHKLSQFIRLEMEEYKLIGLEKQRRRGREQQELTMFVFTSHQIITSRIDWPLCRFYVLCRFNVNLILDYAAISTHNGEKRKGDDSTKSGIMV